MSKSNSAFMHGLTAKRSNRQFFAGLTAIAVCLLTASCNPEAVWETSDVHIEISDRMVSAGFVECAFSTNKDAYYFIDCIPYDSTIDLKEKTKQFMTLALDSALVEYFDWRHNLLAEGEANVAPFSSHVLQYGKVNHFFTFLDPGYDYLVYAFVVDPVRMEPVGKLFTHPVHTLLQSAIEVEFEYRIKGYWSYIYPVDTLGNIVQYYPYVAVTCDSLEAVENDYEIPELYMLQRIGYMTDNKYSLEDNIRNGVSVNDNGLFGNGDLMFQEGHTYYTAIVSCDGILGNIVFYKFTWTGEDYEVYFKDEDNLIYGGEDE